MAIALEFIDFVVPIALIRQKYPGGWEQCLQDHERLIGGRVWFDEHLLRDGAMNPADIESLVDEWTSLGFQPTTELDGQRIWQDLLRRRILAWWSYATLRLARTFRGWPISLAEGRSTGGAQMATEAGDTVTDPQPHEGGNKRLRFRVFQDWLDDGAPYRADIRFDLSPEEAEDFARELKQWCAKPDAFVWKGD